MNNPRVGTIVHYFTAGTPHAVELQPLAAIVTGYQSDGTINLAVFTESGIAINHIYIEHSSTPKYGCWTPVDTEEQ